MVYFISNGTNVKIGKADSTATRLVQLQTGSDVELIVINELEGGYELENKLHAIFDEYNVRGEWFNLPKEHYNISVEEIESMHSSMFKPIKKRKKVKKNKKQSPRQIAIDIVMAIESDDNYFGFIDLEQIAKDNDTTNSDITKQLDILKYSEIVEDNNASYLYFERESEKYNSVIIDKYNEWLMNKY